MTTFILLLDRPNNVQELKAFLFDNNSFTHFFESLLITKSWSADQVAEIVFRDLEEINFTTAVEEVKIGYVRDIETSSEVLDFEGTWEEYLELYEIKSKDLVKRLLRRHGEKPLFLVRYDGGEGTLARAMGRGNLFQKAPHIRIEHQYAMR